MGTRFSHSNVGEQYNGGFCKILLTLNDLFFLIEKRNMTNSNYIFLLLWHVFGSFTTFEILTSRNASYACFGKCVGGNFLEDILWKKFEILKLS